MAQLRIMMNKLRTSKPRGTPCCPSRPRRPCPSSTTCRASLCDASSTLSSTCDSCALSASLTRTFRRRRPSDLCGGGWPLRQIDALSPRSCPLRGSAPKTCEPYLFNCVCAVLRGKGAYEKMSIKYRELDLQVKK